ncbi:MAG: DinB family protein [Ardenticatenaceae bacterium]|nr:DinB family protein [Anaerolineales bacterium]MCB8940775.1 DinB family protein [Ardenticatenaceae bacterium]MCB8972114.1 DinB family protein [Ardenticatenaceae bacterium]
MTHPLVTQLRFARSEFVRCLEGLSDDDAQKRLLPMNSISWMIGHLANQEQFYWVYLGQGKAVEPNLYELVGTGRPATTPPLPDMWQTWHAITAAADEFLDALTAEQLTTYMVQGETKARETTGTMLLRNIYHYWFHTGEAHAVRQQLGHKDLPQFVGNMETAVYRPEST